MVVLSGESVVILFKNPSFILLFRSVKLLKLFMHTSLDPYNTTEEIELKLSDANLKFSDGASIKVNAAALEIFARTASKYDDIR